MRKSINFELGVTDDISEKRFIDDENDFVPWYIYTNIYIPRCGEERAPEEIKKTILSLNCKEMFRSNNEAQDAEETCRIVTINAKFLYMCQSILLKWHAAVS